MSEIERPVAKFDPRRYSIEISPIAKQPAAENASQNDNQISILITGEDKDPQPCGNEDKNLEGQDEAEAGDQEEDKQEILFMDIEDDEGGGNEFIISSSPENQNNAKNFKSINLSRSNSVSEVFESADSAEEEDRLIKKEFGDLTFHDYISQPANLSPKLDVRKRYINNVSFLLSVSTIHFHLFFNSMSARHLVGSPKKGPALAAIASEEKVEGNLLSEEKETNDEEVSVSPNSATSIQSAQMDIKMTDNNFSSVEVTEINANTSPAPLPGPLAVLDNMTSLAFATKSITAVASESVKEQNNAEASNLVTTVIPSQSYTPQEDSHENSFVKKSTQVGSNDASMSSTPIRLDYSISSSSSPTFNISKDRKEQPHPTDSKKVISYEGNFTSGPNLLRFHCIFPNHPYPPSSALFPLF